MKHKAWLILLALLLSVSAAAAIDLPPSIKITAPNTTVENTAVITTIAIDVGDNAGIKTIKLLENGMLNYTHTCAKASTCTLTRAFISNVPANRTYLAIAEDLGGNTKSSQTLTIMFTGSNTPPVWAPVPNITVLEDSGMNLNVIDLSQYVSDNQTSPQAMPYSLIFQQNTSLVNCMIPSGPSVSCNVTLAKASGSSLVTARVTDGPFTRDQNFTVIVLPVNDPPFLNGTLPNITLP